MSNEQMEAKVTFLGDSAVGKTSIIYARCLSRFDSDIAPTVGQDVFTTNVTVIDRTITLKLWDTAGQEKFHSLIPLYLRDSKCCVIVADVTNNDSINNITYWADQCIRLAPNIPIIIAINKMDMIELEDDIVTGITRKLENFKQIIFVSALSQYHLEDLFSRIASEIIQTFSEIEPAEPLKPKSENGCC